MATKEAPALSTEPEANPEDSTRCSSLLPKPKAKGKFTAKRLEFKNWQKFTKLSDVRSKIRDLEKESCCMFSTRSKNKNFGKEHVDVVLLQQRGFQLFPYVGKSPSTGTIPYDGYPFLILGVHRLECNFGKDRRTKEVKPGTFPSRGSKGSKKVNCPALMVVKHVIKFTDFNMGRVCTKKGTTSGRRRVRELMASGEDLTGKYIDEFYMGFSTVEDHKGHPVKGLAAGFRAELDQRVVAVMGEAVRLGLKKVSDINQVIHKYVRKELFQGVKAPHKSNKQFFPTKVDISSFVYRFCLSNLDQEHTQNFVSNWQQDIVEDFVYYRPHFINTEVPYLPHPKPRFAGISFLVDLDSMKRSYLNDTGAPLIFCYQSLWQKRLMSLYGNLMTFLDPAHLSLRCQYPLYFLVVLTNVGYVIVGVIILEKQSQELLQEGLTVLKNWNPEWRPTTFMVSSSEIFDANAVQAVFKDKGTRLYVNDHYREQAWTSWLDDDIVTIEDKEATVKLMREIAAAQSREKLKKALEKLHNNELWKNNEKLSRWFTENWQRRIKQWTSVYCDKTLELMMNVEYLKDSMNELLAHKPLEVYRNRPVNEMVSGLLRSYLPQSYMKYTAMNQDTNNSVTTRLTLPEFMWSSPVITRRKVTARCNGMRYGLAVVGKVNPSVIKVELEPGKQEEVYLGSEEKMPSCTCPEWLKSRLPCIHFFAAVRLVPSLKWDNFSKLYRKCALFEIDYDCNTIVPYTQDRDAAMEVDISDIEENDSVGSASDAVDDFEDGGFISDSPPSSPEVVQAVEPLVDTEPTPSSSSASVTTGNMKTSETTGPSQEGMVSCSHEQTPLHLPDEISKVTISIDEFNQTSAKAKVGSSCPVNLAALTQHIGKLIQSVGDNKDSVGTKELKNTSDSEEELIDLKETVLVVTDPNTGEQTLVIPSDNSAETSNKVPVSWSPNVSISILPTSTAATKAGTSDTTTNAGSKAPTTIQTTVATTTGTAASAICRTSLTSLICTSTAAANNRTSASSKTTASRVAPIGTSVSSTRVTTVSTKSVTKTSVSTMSINKTTVSSASSRTIPVARTVANIGGNLKSYTISDGVVTATGGSSNASPSPSSIVTPVLQTAPAPVVLAVVDPQQPVPRAWVPMQTFLSSFGNKPVVFTPVGGLPNLPLLTNVPPKISSMVTASSSDTKASASSPAGSAPPAGPSIKTATTTVLTSTKTTTVATCSKRATATVVTSTKTATTETSTGTTSSHSATASDLLRKNQSPKSQTVLSTTASSPLQPAKRPNILGRRKKGNEKDSDDENELQIDLGESSDSVSDSEMNASEMDEPLSVRGKSLVNPKHSKTETLKSKKTQSKRKPHSQRTKEIVDLVQPTQKAQSRSTSTSAEKPSGINVDLSAVGNKVAESTLKDITKMLQEKGAFMGENVHFVFSNSNPLKSGNTAVSTHSGAVQATKSSTTSHVIPVHENPKTIPLGSIASVVPTVAAAPIVNMGNILRKPLTHSVGTPLTVSEKLVTSASSVVQVRPSVKSVITSRTPVTLLCFGTPKAISVPSVSSLTSGSETAVMSGTQRTTSGKIVASDSGVGIQSVISSGKSIKTDKSVALLESDNNSDETNQTPVIIDIRGKAHLFHDSHGEPKSVASIASSGIPGNLGKTAVTLPTVSSVTPVSLFANVGNSSKTVVSQHSTMQTQGILPISSMSAAESKDTSSHSNSSTIKKSSLIMKDFMPIAPKPAAAPVEASEVSEFQGEKVGKEIQSCFQSKPTKSSAATSIEPSKVSTGNIQQITGPRAKKGFYQWKPTESFAATSIEPSKVSTGNIQQTTGPRVKKGLYQWKPTESSMGTSIEPSKVSTGNMQQILHVGPTVKSFYQLTTPSPFQPKLPAPLQHVVPRKLPIPSDSMKVMVPASTQTQTLKEMKKAPKSKRQKLIMKCEDALKNVGETLQLVRNEEYLSQLNNQLYDILGKLREFVSVGQTAPQQDVKSETDIKDVLLPTEPLPLPVPIVPPPPKRRRITKPKQSVQSVQSAPMAYILPTTSGHHAQNPFQTGHFTPNTLQTEQVYIPGQGPENSIQTVFLTRPQGQFAQTSSESKANDSCFEVKYEQEAGQDVSCILEEGVDNSGILRILGALNVESQEEVGTYDM